MDLFSSAVFQRHFRFFNFTIYMFFDWPTAVIQRIFVLSMFFVFWFYFSFVRKLKAYDLFVFYLFKNLEILLKFVLKFLRN